MQHLVRSFRYLALLAAIAVVLWFAYAFVDRQFKLSNVQGNWPLVESVPLTDETKIQLAELFSAPFHYLDRGKQSFVFVSKDQQYVLKLFDARCLRSGDSFLFSITEEHCAKKLAQLFEGYRVGAAYDAEHAGLIALQLVPDPTYTLPITLIDRFGIHHQIDLSQVPFVVQQRATPLREVISSMLERGEEEEALKALQQIVEMYLQGYRKGIVDLDHNFMYNTGFVDGHPIRIDLGRLQYQEEVKNPSIYRQDLDKVFRERLREWLERHFPKYHLDQKILEP